LVLFYFPSFFIVEIPSGPYNGQTGVMLVRNIIMATNPGIIAAVPLIEWGK